MSEWVVESEISAKLGYKILIAGLSEAGKTAVKRIFFLKQQTEDVDSLSATINYERMSLTIKNTPITIVDLGGQKIFLKRFLSGFSPFVFSSVKIFLFLIDVANKTSRNNAIQYFTACLEKLRTFSPSAEVFVLLHKNDLVRNSPNYESIHEQLKEQFQLEFPAPLRFFRTTIFKPETVINAFGRIFELVIPSIQQSEFVDSREIGEIEEFHKIDMTLREPELAVAEPQMKPFTSQAAGDPIILEKLQYLMREAVQTSNGPDGTRPAFLGSAASEESSSETVLTSIESEMAPEPSTIIEEMSMTPPSSTSFSSDPITVVTPERSIEAESTEVNPQISQLVEFCRISVEEATEIVNTGHSELFKMAVTSGTPVPLVLDIFLKYLPFIKESQGEEKFKTLTNDRLLDVFFVFLKGKLKEQDIVKCLVLAVERPEMPIDEIVGKYLLLKEKEKKVKIKEEKKKLPEFAEIDIPVETESLEGIISIPNTQGMGFKIDLVDDGLNARLSFHLRGPVGQKELIGDSVVSSEINPDELLYLLAYELNMTGLGIFEDGISSMFFAAKIIHESIRQLREKNLISTSEVTTKKVRSEKGYLAHTVEFIIPMEIEVEGEFVLIPDSEDVAFSIEKAKKGFLLNFVQRGFPIGQANVVESITGHQLSRLLKEAMQLPIESEGAINFATRIIQATINNILKEEIETVPTKPILPTHPKEDDDTSDELKHYLSLLDQE